MVERRLAQMTVERRRNTNRASNSLVGIDWLTVPAAAVAAADSVLSHVNPRPPNRQRPDSQWRLLREALPTHAPRSLHRYAFCLSLVASE